MKDFARLSLTISVMVITVFSVAAYEEVKRFDVDQLNKAGWECKIEKTM